MQSWPYTNNAMTVESIRQKYDPAAFRIAEHRYPCGTSFLARTRAVVWFVLAGSCKVTRDKDLLTTAGQVAEIEAGDLTMTVVGDSELHLVQVWDLRPFQN